MLFEQQSEPIPNVLKMREILFSRNIMHLEKKKLHSPNQKCLIILNRVKG